MKHWTRKLAILLMALATVCAMAITASAADIAWTNGAWSDGKTDADHTGTGHTQTPATTNPTCKETGTRIVTCECGETREDTAAKLTTHTYGAWTTTDTEHSRKCSVCEVEEKAAHSFGDWTGVTGTTNHQKVCADCGKTVTEAHTYANPEEWESNGLHNHKTPCTVCNTPKYAAHSWKSGSSWAADGENHKRECNNCGWVVVEHTYGDWVKVDNNEHKHVCSTCQGEEKEAHEFEYTPNTDGTTHKKSCTKCNTTVVASEAHTYTNGVCVCEAEDPKNGAMTLVSLQEAIQTVSSADGKTFSVTHSIMAGSNNVTALYNTPTYEWKLTKDGETTTVGGNSASYALPAGTAVGSYTLTVKATAALKADTTFKIEQNMTWAITVKSMKSISVTIPENIGTFDFLQQSPQDGISIYEQMASAIRLPNGAHISDCFVSFSTPVSNAGYISKTATTLNKLDEVIFTPAGTGTWTANYTVTYNSTEVLAGTVTITVVPYTKIDALYTATLGENVKLNPSDFQKFWAEFTNNRGSLQRVRITGVTGVSGTLCYGHAASESFHTTANGNDFYVSPITTQKSLNDLTFVPLKSGNTYRAGSVTISFVAYGTTSGYATGSSAGSIVITYTNGAVAPISYKATGSYVTLNVADFNNVYKTATATTNSTFSYTVKFLDLPTYGVLYRNYTNTYYGTSTAVALTKNNMATLTFNNNTAANSDGSLNRVAYVPAYRQSVADTVRYGVYSGNTLLYIGTITFDREDVVVEYHSNAAGVTFSSYDFYVGNSALLQSQYVTFGTPSIGTLYKNYANGKGTVVTPYDCFSYLEYSGVSNFDAITYVPAAGYTGVVEIPFYADSIYSGYASGIVRIYVVSKPFSDVNAASWSAPFINRLYASGIVSGTSATTFSPNANMKYGEALKMILLAAGYQKQTETTGSHWAYNYLQLAYSKSIVSTTNVDLNRVITRTEVAEIAAKALGISKASYVNAGVTAPVDSTNGYVYALYNAGILNGENSGGKNYYNGERGITRAEVAKIICSISDYNK